MLWRVRSRAWGARPGAPGRGFASRCPGVVERGRNRRLVGSAFPGRARWCPTVLSRVVSVRLAPVSPPGARHCWPAGYTVLRRGPWPPLRVWFGCIAGCLPAGRAALRVADVARCWGLARPLRRQRCLGRFSRFVGASPHVCPACVPLFVLVAGFSGYARRRRALVWRRSPLDFLPACGTRAAPLAGWRCYPNWVSDLCRGAFQPLRFLLLVCLLCACDRALPRRPGSGPLLRAAAREPGAPEPPPVGAEARPLPRASARTQHAARCTPCGSVRPGSARGRGTPAGRLSPGPLASCDDPRAFLRAPGRWPALPVGFRCDLAPRASSSLHFARSLRNTPSRSPLGRGRAAVWWLCPTFCLRRRRAPSFLAAPRPGAARRRGTRRTPSPLNRALARCPRPPEGSRPARGAGSWLPPGPSGRARRRGRGGPGPAPLRPARCSLARALSRAGVPVSRSSSVLLYPRGDASPTGPVARSRLRSAARGGRPSRSRL
ncbi:hypothetical protein Tco_0088650 [Tanacetum coccineum]